MVNSNMAIAEIELTGNGSSLDYLLTLDPNGGFIEDVGSTDPSRKTTQPYVKNVTFNYPIGYLPEPVRPGYTFDGWFKTYSGFWTEKPNEYPYKEQIKLVSSEPWLWKRNATFEARWIPVNCTLTWDKNDLEEDPIMAVVPGVPYGSVLGGVVDRDGVPYVSQIPTRTGYKFLGWFTHPIQGERVNEYTNVEAPKVKDEYKQTFYAHWELGMYTMTFDAGDGKRTSQITKAYGSLLTPPKVTRKGYTFVTWNPPVPTTTPGQDMTFTATWQEVAD